MEKSMEEAKERAMEEAKERASGRGKGEREWKENRDQRLEPGSQWECTGSLGVYWEQRPEA